MCCFLPFRFTLPFLCIALFVTNTIQAQSPVADMFCGLRNVSTRSGEVLDYKVFYTLAGMYVGAGQVSFSNTVEMYQRKPVYHVKGEGGTFPSYDWFYKVRDVYESFIDTTTLLPLKFVRQVNEGGTHIYSQVLFQSQLKKAVSLQGSYAVPDCIQDVLSAIYYARNIDFNQYKPGDKIPFSIFLDDQVFPIYLRFLGREILHTRYGDYHTIKFKPLLIEGTIFTGGEQMNVWVTDDNNRLPVLIETPILVGSIKVYLKSFRGLRNRTDGIIHTRNRD